MAILQRLWAWTLEASGLQAAWRHELAVTRQWGRDLWAPFRRWIVPRLGSVVLAIVGAALIGAALEGPLGALMGVVLLAAAVILWVRMSAAARLHENQEAEIARLKPMPLAPVTGSPSPSLVTLRALRDQGDRRKGQFYGVRHSEVNDEIRSGRGEQVTLEKGSASLLTALEKVCGLVDEFPNVPPEHGSYYPQSPKLRERFPQALQDLENCLQAILAVDHGRRNQYKEIELWLGNLNDELRAEGRLGHYQDRARLLRKWAEDYRQQRGIPEAPPSP